MNRSKTPAPQPERPPLTATSSSGQKSLVPVVILVVIVAAIAGVVYIATRGSSVPPQDPLSTIPFDKAVHETEAAVVQAAPAPPPQMPRPVVDSLRLEITTTDSLWISLNIDNVRKGEYLFPPGRTRTWAAKEQFMISMGNAGVATFRLNGKDLGTLGRRGAVARNIVITQSGVQQTQ